MGYRRKKIYEYREFTKGEEPDALRVTIPVNLTFGELDEIPVRSSYEELFDAIAPYVVAWNVVGINAETGAEEMVPPPAEAGRQVLPLLSRDEVEWIAARIKLGHLVDRDAVKKLLTPLATTDDSSSASDSDSSPTVPKDRTSPPSSDATSPGT